MKLLKLKTKRFYYKKRLRFSNNNSGTDRVLVMVTMSVDQPTSRPWSSCKQLADLIVLFIPIAAGRRDPRKVCYVVYVWEYSRVARGGQLPDFGLLLQDVEFAFSGSTRDENPYHTIGDTAWIRRDSYCLWNFGSRRVAGPIAIVIIFY